MNETNGNEKRSTCDQTLPKTEKPLICTHKGDGPQSQHRGKNGRGTCLVKGCKCIEFEWASFLPEYLRDYANGITD